MNVSADVSLSCKQDFADLVAVADANGVDADECVLVLNPTKFSKLLGEMDALVYGDREAVRMGAIPELYGFKAVLRSSYLPEGDLGAIIPYNTLGIVSRWNKPQLAGYALTDKATDKESGLTIGFRAFEDLNEGCVKYGGDMLFGARILQDGIIRLV